MRFLRLFVLLLPVGGVFALDRAMFSRELPDHIVAMPVQDTKVDWTSGFMLARATVRLKRIAIDRKDPEFGSDNTEQSLSAARARARREAREEAALRLVRALEKIGLSSSGGFLDRMRADTAMRGRMGSLEDRFILASDRTGEGYVSVELALPFFGDQGLMELLADNRFGSDNPPESDVRSTGDPMTGILIDVSEFPDFEPALEPRILSSQGRMIYGAEVAMRSCAVHKGLASYHGTRESARKDKRLGMSPYYVFAAGLSGSRKTDVFLDSADVMRITGNEGGRRALSRCAVAFVSGRK